MLDPQVKAQVDITVATFEPWVQQATDSAETLFAPSILSRVTTLLSASYGDALSKAQSAQRNAQQLATSALSTLQEISRGTIEGRAATDQDALRVMRVLVRATDDYKDAADNVRGLQPLALLAKAAFQAFVSAADEIYELGKGLGQVVDSITLALRGAAGTLVVLAPLLAVGALGFLLLAYAGPQSVRAARAAKQVRKELAGVRRRRRVRM